MPLKVLVVCTGNLCRSPLAERLIALRAAERGVPVDVASAGTRARNGMAMHEETQRVLRGYGGDPEGFASRLLNPTILAGTDLVLTASGAHSSAVAEQAPVAWKKTFSLLEAAALVRAHPAATLADLHRLRQGVAGEELDLTDPIGQESAVFDTTGHQISEAVDAIVDLLARTIDQTDQTDPPR